MYVSELCKSQKGTCRKYFSFNIYSHNDSMFNCSASLEWDNSCNEDDKGDGEDGKEDGKDDVGLPFNLLRSRHLPNCGVAQHENKLETGRGNMILEDSEDYPMTETWWRRWRGSIRRSKCRGLWDNQAWGCFDGSRRSAETHWGCWRWKEKEEDRCVQQGN